MKTLLFSSLAAAIALTLSPQTGSAIASPAASPEFEQSEPISLTYAYRRYNSGAGRREILS
jgi:hypothetical protein